MVTTTKNIHDILFVFISIGRVFMKCQKNIVDEFSIFFFLYQFSSMFDFRMKKDKEFLVFTFNVEAKISILLKEKHSLKKKLIQGCLDLLVRLTPHNSAYF